MIDSDLCPRRGKNKNKQKGRQGELEPYTSPNYPTFTHRLLYSLTQNSDGPQKWRSQRGRRATAALSSPSAVKNSTTRNTWRLEIEIA